MLKKLPVRFVLTWVFVALTPIYHPVSPCAYGQSPHSAVEILRSVKSLQIPEAGYQVTVKQHLSNVKSQSAFSTAPEYTGRAEFQPSLGLKRINPTNAERSDQPPPATVLVDLGAFLDALLTYPARTVEQDTLFGRATFRIQGQSPDKTQGCIIWVDQEHLHVTQIHSYLLERLFAEATIEYLERQGLYWLPSTIQLHHMTDDSWVTLEYSDYVIEK
ncbi:MAG TPA: hypothetical protein VM118_15550 [Acidobacteriota bacterium]|nr:hypothetical protein [Acidobacteriota bacterium]